MKTDNALDRSIIRINEEQTEELKGVIWGGGGVDSGEKSGCFI